MKILITEEQYLSLTEQLDIQGKSTILEFITLGGPFIDPTIVRELDTHTKMTILEISTAFIPFVGPFISAGIGLADAALYYKEGDKKTAGLVGMFSIIPGIGGLAAKMGLKNVSTKILANIGKKISKGGKLSEYEVKVAKKVAKHRKLLQDEINKLAKSNKNVKLAKQNVKKRLQRKAGAKQLVKTSGGYYGLGQTYNYSYDKLNQQNVNVDLNKINVNKISKVNSDAALNTKF